MCKVFDDRNDQARVLMARVVSCGDVIPRLRLCRAESEGGNGGVGNEEMAR